MSDKISSVVNPSLAPGCIGTRRGVEKLSVTGLKEGEAFIGALKRLKIDCRVSISNIRYVAI